MFQDIFKEKIESKFFSPGRINILGEHIDYNGGYCLPMAIDKGTTAYVSKNNQKAFRVFSENFKDEGIYKINPKDRLFKEKSAGWSNLFRGMVSVFQDKLQDIPFGLNIYFNGDIPTGSGLSSSASIAMLIGTIFNDYYNIGLSILELVFLTKKMENEFLGAHTGILDQYAIGNGKLNKAMLIDTSVPSHTYFPSNFGDYVFLIVSTNKTRELADSKYNERVKECKEGLKILQKNGFKIKNICELKTNQLPEIKEIIQNDVIFRRVKHCINEQERTISAAKSLKDINKLGQLLYAGQESLKDDYEVTGEHLDFIYDFSKKESYVAGARMTGAGFGGSAIVLMPKNKVDEYSIKFKKEYTAKFNITPTFLIASSSDGVGKC